MTDELPAVVRFHIEAARRLGLEARVLDPEYGFLFEVGDGRRSRLLIGGRSPLNDSVAARVAGDKYYTKVVLADRGFRVPEAARCLAPGYFQNPELDGKSGPAPGRAFAARRGYPLIVKPNRKSHGREVVEVADEPELRAALERVWAIDYVALVEEKATGLDLRVDFLDGEFLIGYRRSPVVVVGDGSATVRQLVEERDSRTRDPEFWSQVGNDPRWRSCVSERGLDAGSVLAEGETLALGGTVLNLHRWATAELLPEISEGLAALGRAVGETLNLRFYGIDCKAPRLDAAMEEVTVIEVNASPLLTGMAKMGYPEEALTAQTRVLSAIWNRSPGPEPEPSGNR